MPEWTDGGGAGQGVAAVGYSPLTLAHTDQAAAAAGGEAATSLHVSLTDLIQFSATVMMLMPLVWATS